MTVSDAEDTVQSIVEDLRSITETPWKGHCDNIYEVADMALEAIDAQEEIIEDLKDECADEIRNWASRVNDLEGEVFSLELTIKDLQATIDALRGGES